MNKSVRLIVSRETVLWVETEFPPQTIHMQWAGINWELVAIDRSEPTRPIYSYQISDNLQYSEKVKLCVKYESHPGFILSDLLPYEESLIDKNYTTGLDG